MQKIKLTETFSSIQEAAIAAVNQFLGRPESTDRIYLNNKSVCVKALPITSVYPEIKERISAKKADIYVLTTVDLKKQEVFLEGWIDVNNLVQDKNLSVENETYYVSYKDIFPIEILCH